MGRILCTEFSSSCFCYRCSSPIFKAWHLKRQLGFDLWVSQWSSSFLYKHINETYSISGLYLPSVSTLQYIVHFAGCLLQTQVLICIFERGKMLNPDQSSYVNVFSIVFEVVSAYVSQQHIIFSEYAQSPNRAPLA